MVLNQFSFGFSDGEERYTPRSPDHYEAVRWTKGGEVVIVMHLEHQDSYELLYSDKVGQYEYTSDNAPVIKSARKLPFDPMLFRCIAYEWIGIPAEVT